MSEKELFKNDTTSNREERKMFKNRGANISLIIVGTVLLLSIVGAVLFVAFY